MKKEIIKKTLEAGKHSFSEKPLATNFNDGLELKKIADEKNLKIGRIFWKFSMFLIFDDWILKWRLGCVSTKMTITREYKSSKNHEKNEKHVFCSKPSLFATFLRNPDVEAAFNFWFFYDFRDTFMY